MPGHFVFALRSIFCQTALKKLLLCTRKSVGVQSKKECTSSTNECLWTNNPPLILNNPWLFEINGTLLVQKEPLIMPRHYCLGIYYLFILLPYIYGMVSGTLLYENFLTTNDVNTLL